VYAADYSDSVQVIERLLSGRVPGLPRLGFNIVDVRDVADLHIRAMTDPAARGERFLACGGDFIWMAEVARILKRRLGDSARKVSTREIPNWLVRLVAIWNRTVRQTLPELGKVKTASNEKAKRVLGWSPRSNEEAIVASGESLVRLGLLGGPRR